MPDKLTKWTSKIHHGDCIKGMHELPKDSIDLIFADPPFNIGFDYDVYQDKVEHQKYIDWSNEWISAAYNALKPDGTFWLAIGDEYAAELKLESQKIGFHCRSWVIWYYTFGVNCSKKFTRSHAHLFHFVKDPKNFTFRDKDLDNRVPSARELVYNDKRAKPTGRLPDDTWIIRPADAQGRLFLDDLEAYPPKETVTPPQDDNNTFALRPQELQDSFQSDEDTWYIPRVAGTFKERAGFHGCQMPEQLLGRIIRVCSHPGDSVLDPFSGSATTLAVAKKMGRKFVGFDLSKEYVKHGRERLKTVKIGDRLNGSHEPLKSTYKPKTKSERKKDPVVADPELSERRYQKAQIELTGLGIVEAFRLTHNGYSADRVVADPALNLKFAKACGILGIVGNRKTWNSLLFRQRKSGKLTGIDTSKRTAFDWKDIDQYLFGSEIAWQQLLFNGDAKTVDEILCDPDLAKKFDEIAMKFAPGFKPLEYRWATLKLRKEAKTARGRSAVLKAPKFSPMIPLTEIKASNFEKKMGLYVLKENKTKTIYAGETLDLKRQVSSIKKNAKAWNSLAKSIFVQTIPLDYLSAGNLAWQSCLVKKLKPKFNTDELRTR